MIRVEAIAKFTVKGQDYKPGDEVRLEHQDEALALGLAMERLWYSSAGATRRR